VIDIAAMSLSVLGSIMLFPTAMSLPSLYIGYLWTFFIVERIFYSAFVAECAGPMVRLLQAIADRLVADTASSDFIR
jgi:hypothetical protein